MYHIPFTTTSAATCDPRYIKQSASSNYSTLNFSLTCIRPSFPYLEHLITLLLPTFTLNNLLSHTLPNSLTSLHNFSESATIAVTSVNISWFISNMPQLTLSSYISFKSTLAFTSHTTPSIYSLNSHGDITQPCHNPTLTGNHSLTSIPTRGIHALLYT